MAKTLMSHPSILSTTRAHLLFLRQSLPSSLLRIPKRPFVSQPAVLSNNSLLSRVDTDKRANLSYDGSNFFKGSFGRSSSRGFGAGATPVNDPGAIDSPLMQSTEKKIKEQLEAESVTVKDAYGDGRHVSIYVFSSAFEGQSAVNRQRMVYKAIWEELQSTVHAVDQMTTRTPAEAASQK